MKPLLHVLALVATLASLPVGAKTVSGTVSVIDGDTIEIHGNRIRLSAIDAIESRQRCLMPDGRQWNCGRDAAMALSDEIGGRPLTCSVSGTYRYGRYVAVCTVSGADIGAWMVENGWAVAYRRYGLAYVAAEDRARRAGLGIWASEFEMPWDWRKSH